MRTRIVPMLCALSALVISGLTGCSDAQPQSPPGETGNGGTAATGGANAGSLAPPRPTIPEVVDINTVDLGAMEWLYSKGGFELPVTVKLSGGTATADGDGVPITYTLDSVWYGDADGDGDDDAVARINRTQGMGVEGLFYVWLAQGPDAVQVKYPIAATGRCSTYVESVVIEGGAIELTEYLRLPGKDDNIPCSDPGTGLKKRTVTVSAAGSEIWPIQTKPVAAWGGLCTGPRFQDTGPGIRDLWAAPSKESPVVAVASPDGGAMFEQKEAPLTDRDGWALVGFRVLGVKSDIGGTDLACAWAVN